MSPLCTFFSQLTSFFEVDTKSKYQKELKGNSFSQFSCPKTRSKQFTASVLKPSVTRILQSVQEFENIGFFFSLMLNVNLPSCKLSCYFLPLPEQTLASPLPFSDILCIFEHSSESFLKPSLLWTAWIHSKLLGGSCFPEGYSHWSFLAFLQLAKTFLKCSDQNWTKYSSLGLIIFKYSGHLTSSYILLRTFLFHHLNNCAWLLHSSTTELTDTQDSYSCFLVFLYKFAILRPAFCILLFQPSSLRNVSHLCP